MTTQLKVYGTEGRKGRLDAAEAYLRGIERRIAAGLNPLVWSVASVFISRWDSAVAATTSPAHC